MISLPDRDQLLRRVFSSSSWVLLGFGTAQIVRFLANIILARLLFPEAFGLMLIVTTILMALEMFSDTGIHALLVQSKRGDQAEVLATTFTVKVLRGFLLWALGSIVASPLAIYFEKPEIASLLPVASVSMIFLGFMSNKVFLASRNLALKRVMLLNIVAQLVSSLAMILFALIEPSVWALAVGALFGAFVKSLTSHIFLPGPKDRFGWDKSAAWELFNFGKWILLSTILAFLAGRGEVLVLGRLLNANELGVFAIAISMARVPGDILNKISGAVFFPAFSEVFRRNPERLHVALAKSRLAIISIAAVIFGPIAIFGGQFVDSVYDLRYSDAGWMLQIMSCGFGTAFISRSYDGVLHAKGMSRENTTLQLAQVILKFSSFIVGYYFFGLPGFVIGISFSFWLSYPVLAAIMHRSGVWQPRIDAYALLVAATLSIVFFLFVLQLPVQ